MIKRGKKGTMQQCLEQSAERLANGINVGVFPQVLFTPSLFPRPTRRARSSKSGHVLSPHCGHRSVFRRAERLLRYT